MRKMIISGLLTAAMTAPAAWAGGDAEAGKGKAAACAGCHGANGVSPAPTFPHIGGQYEDYLLRTLQRYKSGERQNPIMQGQVAALNEQDLKDLAAYYASQDGALVDGTVKP